MDPTLEVDQTQSTYWRRIHEYFHGNKKFESNRSEGSLINCWSGIQHDVNILCGCVPGIEARNHSGWSVDDKVITQFTANILFVSNDHLSVLHFHVYFGFKCADRKCMYTVQGRR
jgi:hypothetical protein